MCGRFYNHLKAMHDWADILSDWPGDESMLRYNVSPTSVVPVVSINGVISAHWGMIPSWAKAFKMNYATFNARIETIEEKASFKNAWKKGKTCVVPVGGYYEWRTEDGVKQPYAIHSPDSCLMLAGLWENWNDKLSFTVLTEEAKGNLVDLHHRMPIMLNKEQSKAWLAGGDTNLTTANVEHLIFYPVDRKVGNSRNEGEDLIKPI